MLIFLRIINNYAKLIKVDFHIVYQCLNVTNKFIKGFLIYIQNPSTNADGFYIHLFSSILNIIHFKNIRIF